jgi:HD-like signal output (HDOD) protein
MTLAFSASWLSLFARVGRSDQAFLAGMLHDIGQPLALRSTAALLVAGEIDNRIIDAIPAIVDRVHVAIGASLSSAWSLPEYLRVAAAQHHDEVVAADPALDDVHIVRVVDGVKALRDNAITELGRRTLQQSADTLRLDHRMMRVASTQYAELAARVTQIFGVADPLTRPRHHARPAA